MDKNTIADYNLALITGAVITDQCNHSRAVAATLCISADVQRVSRVGSVLGLCIALCPVLNFVESTFCGERTKRGTMWNLASRTQEK